MTIVASPPDRRSGRPFSGRAGLLVRPVFLVAALVALWLVIGTQDLDAVEARNLNGPEITKELIQHLKLTVISTLLTIVIAIPLGIVLTRSRSRVASLIGLGLGNLGQAIPSVGLIVLFALWFDVGFWYAVIALVVYAVLPVLRNTMVGLEGVDPVLIEAARGMGLSRMTVLLQVELPLAVPVILAGVRTALVVTVASATLAAFIDGGGLGEGMIAGLVLSREWVTAVFGIIVAVLALFIDWLGLLAEQFLRPKGI